MTDRVKFGNATVEDVFVKFNLGYGNAADVVVHLDEKLDDESVFPMECDPDASNWIDDVNGVYVGYHDGPVQPPADTAAYTQTTEVPHVTADTEDRVRQLSHVVKRKVNEEDPASCLTVSFLGAHRTSKPVDVDTVQQLLDIYVNGPLGTDSVSYIWHQREVVGNYGWDSLNSWTCREDFKPYSNCKVALVRESICTWEPKRVADIEDDDEVYSD